MYYVLPNLEAMNFRGAASHLSPVDPTRALLGFAIAVAWSTVFLGAAWAVFRRKDL